MKHILNSLINFSYKAMPFYFKHKDFIELLIELITDLFF